MGNKNPTHLTTSNFPKSEKLNSIHGAPLPPPHSLSFSFSFDQLSIKPLPQSIPKYI